MLLHNIGKNIPVFRKGKALNRRHTGERLEPEFADVTEEMIPVVCKRLQAVPYLPVMTVSPVLIPGHIKAPAGRGAGRPIEGVRILLLHNLRQDILIQFDIIRNLLFFFGPYLQRHKGFNLIIAAPQRQGRMVPQPPDIIPELGADTILKFL